MSSFAHPVKQLSPPYCASSTCTVVPQEVGGAHTDKLAVKWSIPLTNAYVGPCWGRTVYSAKACTALDNATQLTCKLGRTLTGQTKTDHWLGFKVEQS